MEFRCSFLRRHFAGNHWPRHDMSNGTTNQNYMSNGTTNQKYYPDFGSSASSVWNFGARFSDVISREIIGRVTTCQTARPIRTTCQTARPIRSTTQISVVARHQYGISVLVSQTSFHRETCGGVAKCRLLSQAKSLKKPLLLAFMKP